MIEHNATQEQRLTLENIPETPDELKSKIGKYRNPKSSLFVDWLPKGDGMLVASRQGETFQLHKVMYPKGDLLPLTSFNEPVDNAHVCPSSKYNGFLFRMDQGGNENAQIYWYALDSDGYELISDGKSKNTNIKWSNDGEKFAFSSTRKNGASIDIYIAEMQSMKQAKFVVDGSDGALWNAQDWSPDDRLLLLNQTISASETYSYVLDLDSLELQKINKDLEPAVFMGMKWSVEGDSVFCMTNRSREIIKLEKWNLRTGEISNIAHSIDFEMSKMTMSRDRRKIILKSNEDGYARIYSIDAESFEFEKCPVFNDGQINGIKFHPSENKIAFTYNSPRQAGEVFTLDLENFKEEQWTFGAEKYMSTEHFPVPDLIWYDTFDEIKGKSRKIPAFVYKPNTTNKSLPVLIVIHGGPEAQHVPAFNFFIPMLVNELKIAVVAPNVRGSTGYGNSFAKLDDQYKREDSVKDIGKLIEWIQSREEFDGGRIGLYGGSYGGYMVLASMIHFSNQITCAVNNVGISNFVTFLKNTSNYRKDLRRVEYGDERDPEMRKFLESISPTTHAHKINKPLFVTHGANDPRVPLSEANQIVEAVRDNDVEVWYMVAHDEGHGFRKKANRDRMVEAVYMFLEKYL